MTGSEFCVMKKAYPGPTRIHLRPFEDCRPQGALLFLVHYFFPFSFKSGNNVFGVVSSASAKALSILADLFLRNPTKDTAALVTPNSRAIELSDFPLRRRAVLRRSWASKAINLSLSIVADLAPLFSRQSAISSNCYESKGGSIKSIFVRCVQRNT